MVQKENDAAKGNSLLWTAANKRLGSGKFASILLRGAAKPPVKKVKVSTSDASRVSDLTASVIHDARPTFVKEVTVDDIDVESCILGISLKSGDSFSAKDFGKENPVAGVPKTTTPQPSAYKLPPRKYGVPMEKKSMEIQAGIRINAPSPMSLDRIAVQMGQERTAPESEEYKQQREEKHKLEEKERQKEEYKKAKKERIDMLKEDLHNEIGEGFEMQLDDEELVPAKKKSLLKTILGKIRPKSPRKLAPMTANQARALARQAMLNSKKQKRQDVYGKPPLHNASQLPVPEVTVDGKEDSVSDLDSSGRKHFPVQEILMGDGDQSRDDESVSTLGTAHVLERMRPGGHLSNHRYGSGRDIRDPTPTDELEAMGREEMFHPLGAKNMHSSQPLPGISMSAQALFDQIDSGTLTEDAEAVRNGFACNGKPRQTNMNTRSPKPFEYALSAMCLRPAATAAADYSMASNDEGDNDSAEGQEMTESASEKMLQSPQTLLERQEAPESHEAEFTNAIESAISHVKRGMAEQQRWDTTDDSTFSGIDLKKTLSPIEEGEDFSPIHGEFLNSRREIPDLEVYDPENPISHKRWKSSERETNEASDPVIDLTNLASPFSQGTEDGIKGEKGQSPVTFSFDDFMDLAASKLNWKKADDRYAIEGDESPRKVIRGQNVAGGDLEDRSIPVVQGVKLNGKGRSINETTPKARGGTNPMSNEVSPQSSFEVYEHPEGDIVMWSENHVQPKKSPHTKTPTPKRFAGYFSDGLFDLLSMDESVNRGRKKVPFLSEQPTTSEVVKNVKEESHELSPRSPESDNQCMFDFVLENDVCGKANKKENDASDKNFNKMAATATSNHQADIEDAAEDPSDDVAGDQGVKMDPNLGVMCGAVPLYFMYAARNNTSDKDTKKKDKEDNGDGALLKPKSPNRDIKKKKTTNEGIIQIEDNLALKALEESTPKSQGKGFLPMASPKKDTNDVDATSEEIEEPPLPQENEPQQAGKEDAEKILLAGDDAYWDTLSTIASTKDKSLESARANNTTGLVNSVPGPIPVEITMTNKANDESTTALEMQNAIGKVNHLMEDENSAEVIPSKSHGKQDGYSEVKIFKSNGNAATFGRSDRAPFSYNNYSSEPSNGTASGRDESSDDNSGLLLAVTRSDGGNGSDGKSPRNGPMPRNAGQNIWSEPDSGRYSYSASLNNFCDDFHAGFNGATQKAAATGMMSNHNGNGRNAAINIWSESDSERSSHDASQTDSRNDFHTEAKGAIQEVATTGMMFNHNGSGKPFNFAPENDRRGGLRPYFPKSPNSTASRSTNQYEKSTQSHVQRESVAPSGRTTGITKGSNRCVSWGFEEIYEDSRSHHDPPSDGVQTSNKAIMSAAAEAAAATASLNNDGMQIHSQSAALTGSAESGQQKDLSDDDEQELISRILQLSKDLLSSMTAQDLEGADDEVVKSLMSFGTEGTYDKLSLAEISQTITPRSKEPSTTDEATGLDNNTQGSIGAVADPREVSAKTANVPSSVQVKSAGNLPTPNSVRPLGAVPKVEKNSSQVKVPGLPSGRGSKWEESKSSPSSLGTDIGPPNTANPPLRFPAKFQVLNGGKSADPPTNHQYSGRNVSAVASSSTGYMSGSTEATGATPSSESSGEGLQQRGSPNTATYRSLSSEVVHNSASPASTNHTSQAVQAAPSGLSEDSPIDVENLFSKYDNLANHLIEANAELKSMADNNQMEDASSSGSSPHTMTRLDQLRAQRAQALARLHGTKASSPGSLVPREKDRVSSYGHAHRSHSMGPTPIHFDGGAADDSSMIDRFETSSFSSDKTTPSMKARELRRQLDQALQASRTIRTSQAQLESEMENFKTRFYQKNGAMEDKALRALGGL